MIDHLSYSSITLYQTCGRAWRYKYIDQIPSQGSPALILGSLVHGAIETIVSNNYESSEKAYESSEKALNESWEKCDKSNINWQGETPESVFEKGNRLLSSNTIWHGIHTIKPLILDDGNPAIEKKVELRVPGVSIPVIGYIDIILDDGTPADFKTAAKKWTDAQAQKSLQSLFYIAALNQLGFYADKTSGAAYKFVHLIFVKTKKPKFQRLEHWHTSTELFFLLDMIKACWDGIQANVFMPNPDSWKCSPQYCDQWDICRGKE